MSRLAFRLGGRRFIGITMAFCTVSFQCLPVFSQSVGNLDLGSTVKSDSTPSGVVSPVTILVGGRPQQVLPGTSLTPAQSVAVQQVLQGGSQSIIVGLQGNATGGQVVVPNPQSFSGMNIPRGVSVIGDFSSGQAALMSGNFVNAGTFFAISRDAAVTNAILQASNIINSTGASIRSLLPVGGLVGFADAINNLSLTLIAKNSVINNGIISSAGDLNVLAGQQIINGALSTGTGTMHAVNNLNVLSSSIRNHGTLVSDLGSVNVASPSLYASVNALGGGLIPAFGELVNINNTGGSIQALNGNVNIGGSQLGSSAVLSVLNGTITAPTIRFDGGAGAVRGVLDTMTGTVNVYGYSAQVGSRTGDLQLGTLKIDGDPTFFSTGNINIIGDISAQENLAILAGGNITAASPFNISTTDGTGLGHDLYMVAGAKLVLGGTPTPSNSTPTLVPLLPGQLATVIGASTTGGSISLAGSTLDTRSGGGDKNGGKVTLIAYAGSGTGGIENLAILTGGSGKGSNGTVNLIAGGQLGGGNAIEGIAVNAVGGSAFAGSDINFSAAVPLGSATFDSAGKASGSFSPGTPTNFNILVNQLLTTDGGNITFATNGNLTNTAEIYSSGAAPGRNAGSITARVGSANVMATLRADGADGDPGSGAILGFPGGLGQAGGSGGDISLSTTGLLQIDGNIFADGGAGGNGGNGGGGLGPQAGGFGGSGGRGGLAGSIALKAEDFNILQNPGFLMTASGGDGGDGGKGGNAGSGGSIGKAGGAGGAGGLAAKGGRITAESGSGNLELLGFVTALGGDGGSGGGGGNGGAASGRGGAGGDSGFAGAGASGGSIDLSSTSGFITLAFGTVTGGQGGQVKSSGSGGAGAVGGNAGLMPGTGAGGDGGSVTLLSLTGAINLTDNIEMSGGFAADQIYDSGSGSDGTTTGGNGGNIFNGGAGGDGGMLRAKTKGAIVTAATIQANGGGGGSQASFAGTGGTGNNGGAGGSLGDSGAGGKGGSVSLTSTSNSVSIASPVSVFGGAGGISSGTAGAGGNGVTLKGGRGGSVGSGGDGGSGGSLTVSSNAGVAINGTIDAFGGAGGDVSGIAGDGGNGAGPIGGVGGNLLAGGAGGDGGRISIEGKANIDTFNINGYGGVGGSLLGIAGKGGDGKVGATGGSAKSSGAGGNGGMLTLKTTQTQPGPGLITISNSTINLSGGVSGFYNATGGNGGAGTAGDGGLGGSLGNQGSGGDGGKIFITGLDLLITPTGAVFANGGNSSGYGNGLTKSGDGGNGGGPGGGGSGGAVGFAGSGGKGGMIQISIDNTLAIDNGGGSTDTIAARGGNVLENKARSGKGGNAGIAGGAGGDGGKIAFNGNGGDGGSITIDGNTGDMTGIAIVAAAGGQVRNVTSVSGNGGDAGLNGAGGNSGAIGNNGNGGDGGKISISTSSGGMFLSPLLAVGQDIGFFSPTTGDGGKGGSVSGNGGNSGSIGNNGAGGNGGTITIISKTGAIGPGGNAAGSWIAHAGTISPSFQKTGNGGDATDGRGGDSGAIGNGGRAGDGGTIIINSLSGNVITPKGTVGAAGADAGLMLATTGNGGNVLSGVGGNSGSIGANSSGGKGGTLKITTNGTVLNNGGVILPGGIANGSGNTTGHGGTSADGNGGNSGNIFGGGNGGKGGTIVIKIAGDYTSSEAINANGGNAAILTYAPVTGNGGDGTSKGGNSGNISAAGRAGEGGTIELNSKGTVAPDRLLANGGDAGSDLFPSLFRGDMEGRTGNGGTGLVGGNAGVVGDGVVGGKGGKVTVYAGVELIQAVQFYAIGGNGGAQAGVGGNGGNGSKSGGVGGSVGSGGDGGWGGEVSLTVNVGPTLNIREAAAYGGDGGNNSGLAGRGGDAIKGAGAGGAGGDVGGTGVGGNGGSLKAEIINLALNPTVIDIDSLDGLNFFGGRGGSMTGVAGNGGNGLGNLGTLDSVGGAGGSIGIVGGGGKGGSIEFKIPEGDVALMNDIDVAGGAGGAQQGIAGNGGTASKSKTGGIGGSVGIQGDGGEGGSFKFSGGSISLPGGLTVTARGGDANIFDTRAGNGGNGGGRGGDGGSVGSAGGGGNGGTIEWIASDGITIDGTVDALGGKRFPFLAAKAIAGNGGNAGNKGGDGGKGGDVKVSGAGGLGGSITLKSITSDVGGTGIVSVTGGNTSAVDFTAGNGGNAKLKGTGGGGGDVGPAGGGGKGGLIYVEAAGDITVDTFFASGGSIDGVFVGRSGSGGNGGASAGDSGNAGDVFDAGAAGDGGRIQLKSTGGDVIIGSVVARGGNGNDVNSVGGTGGSQALARGDGGKGGAVGNNADGGKGGTLEIEAKLSVQSTATWDVTGGNVGAYNSVSGSGGVGGPTVGTVGGESGGEGGRVGDNGTAGGGGSISIKGGDLDVTLAFDLIANGGNVTGVYSGVGGTGGVGGSSGGDGGSAGNNGGAGSGGSISIETRAGNIITASMVASGGSVTSHEGEGGLGGFGTKTGGGGGSVGAAASGGAGGTFRMLSKFGNITVNGSVNADGSIGGDHNGVAGDASDGNSKGGDGGFIDGAGNGGQGGRISIEATSGTVLITGSVTANKAAGGNQFGEAGAGGNAITSTPLPSEGIGGAGGALGGGGQAGFVGLLGAANGTISITAKSQSIEVNGDVRADGADGGDNFGFAGDGGTGFVKGGQGGIALGAGDGAKGGRITLSTSSASGVLQVDGVISANGGNGGDQNAFAGNGGDALGSAAVKPVGGNGGDANASGDGGDGGTITLKTQNIAYTTVTVNPGLAGSQNGTVGAGGTGLFQNGDPGTLVPAGMNGDPGTIITYDAWPAEDADEHDLKKRRARPTYIALESKSVKYADFVQVPASNQSSNFKGVSYVQPSVPGSVQNAIPAGAFKSSVPNLVTESTCGDALRVRLAALGIDIAAGDNGDNFELIDGAILFAPTQKTVVRTEHGILEIGAGSKVVVEVDGEATVIRTLHDRKRNDVRFVSGPTAMEVNVGNQLVVTTNATKSLKDFGGASGIAVRNVQSHALSNGLTAHASEFSMLSAFVADRTLNALYQSTAAADRKHFEQIEKNAGILVLTTMKKGAYR